MKVLQVIPYFCFGGAETMCENICYALQSMNHEVCVVCLYDEHTPISDRMEAAGIRILYLDKKLGLDVSMVPKLYKLMCAEKPDVVHTHMDVAKYAVAAAKMAGVKQCVHTVHNVAEKESTGIVQKLNKLYFRLKWAKPVGLSPEIRTTIAEVYGLPEEEIPFVYNGLDLSLCVPKESYDIGQTASLLHIGRLSEQKNHEGLLMAYKLLRESYPQCHLHLVGEGELREQVEALVRELSLEENITFHGLQSDVHPFLHNADIFLLPSRYEGMPMTIIEAMATGLPIVATEVGGVPDMVTNGESAMLTPCEPAAVADACLKLLQNPELREKLGSNALRESEKFSAMKMAESYCQVYQS